MPKPTREERRQEAARRKPQLAHGQSRATSSPHNTPKRVATVAAFFTATVFTATVTHASSMPLPMAAELLTPLDSRVDVGSPSVLKPLHQLDLAAAMAAAHAEAEDESEDLVFVRDEDELTTAAYSMSTLARHCISNPDTSAARRSQSVAKRVRDRSSMVHERMRRHLSPWAR